MAQNSSTVVFLDTVTNRMLGSGVPMVMRQMARLAAGTCLLVAFSVGSASAEIVFLSSGRTLSVKDHRLDGDAIILLMRTGGEVRCDKSLVEKIVPDQVEHPDPAQEPPGTARVQGSARGQDLAARLYGRLYYLRDVRGPWGGSSPLVRALIQVESKYNPRARSSRGRWG